MDAERRCHFVPAHEPWTCRVHKGVRTSLDEPQCDVIRPAKPLTAGQLDNLRRANAEGRVPYNRYVVRGLLATIDALAAPAVTETADLDLYAIDRLLAVSHRDGDEPCACDECMSYGAEDAGADWYRIPAANRIVMRILDGADVRFAALAGAFHDHDAALAGSTDTEEVVEKWDQPTGLPLPPNGRDITVQG